MSGDLQYQYLFLILHLLTFKTARKTISFFLTPELQICKRPGDLKSSEVEKLAPLKEEHELNDTYSNDEGKFAIFNISYLRFTVLHGLPIHYNLSTIAEITLPVLSFNDFL